MLRHSVDLAKLQLQLGGEVHWEHPRHALSWREQCVSKLRAQLHEARLDGCTFGRATSVRRNWC